MIAMSELKYLEDDNQILNLELLKMTLDFVFSNEKPVEHFESDPDDKEDDIWDDIFGGAVGFCRHFSDAAGEQTVVNVERCLSRSLGSSSRLESESGYSSLLSTPQRNGSRFNSESLTSVTDQLFKWSPSLPTTPGSPSKMLPSRRSQSADSPKKTCQLVSHIALQPRASRQLFPTTTNTRENSVQRDRRGDLNYTSGRVSPSGQGGSSSATSVINANKYKTMHCRNYSLKGACEYGTKCQFAHGSGELRVQSQHPKFKTEMCRNYIELGYCEWRDACIFRHGDSDLINPKLLKHLASTEPNSDV
ncbi:uncharacterized protein LOC134840363 [Symsagittifera roscoffensis]|uniref:uncharacterized protein LOC134840363 n=1 Tax=Symsagittifera roscoffensis TaxID=84072 RepID=UPI00307C396A